MHYVIKQFSIKKLLTNRYNNIWPLYIYERRRHIHVYIAFSLPSFLPSSLLHPVSPFLCLSVTLSVTLSLSPLSLSTSLSLSYCLSLSLLPPSHPPSSLTRFIHPLSQTYCIFTDRHNLSYTSLLIGISFIGDTSDIH